MADWDDFRWPTKIRRNSIDDPFLRLLVAKYENQIQWQGVTTSAALQQYVAERMLPSLLQQVDPNGQKTLYVTRIVNLANALANEADPEVQQARQLRTQSGAEAAEAYLLSIVNQRKRELFSAWVQYVTDENDLYKASPAFQYLILRAVFQLSPASERRSTVNCNAEVLAMLYDQIKTCQLLPMTDLAAQYCRLMIHGVTSGTNASSLDGWRYFPRSADTQNAARLAALVLGSGWCIANAWTAGHYLRESAFYILSVGGKARIALRVQGNTVVECRGPNNGSPEAARWVDIHLLLESEQLLLDSCRGEHRRPALLGLVDGFGLEAWTQQITWWPYGFRCAPTLYREQLQEVAQRLAEQRLDTHPEERCFYHLSFGDPTSPETAAAWGDRIEQRPDLVVICPAAIQQQSEYRRVLKTAVCNLLDRLVQEREELTPVTLTLLKTVLADADDRATVEVWGQAVAQSIDVDGCCPAAIRQRSVYQQALKTGCWAMLKTWATCRTAIKPEKTTLLRTVLEDVTDRVAVGQWARAVRQRPALDSLCPAAIRQQPEYCQALLKGWADRNDPITPKTQTLLRAVLGDAMDAETVVVWVEAVNQRPELKAICPAGIRQQLNAGHLLIKGFIGKTGAISPEEKTLLGATLVDLNAETTVAAWAKAVESRLELDALCPASIRQQPVYQQALKLGCEALLKRAAASDLAIQPDQAALLAAALDDASDKAVVALWTEAVVQRPALDASCPKAIRQRPTYGRALLKGLAGRSEVILPGVHALLGAVLGDATDAETVRTWTAAVGQRNELADLCPAVIRQQSVFAQQLTKTGLRQLEVLAACAVLIIRSWHEALLSSVLDQPGDARVVHAWIEAVQQRPELERLCPAGIRHRPEYARALLAEWARRPAAPVSPAQAKLLRTVLGDDRDNTTVDAWHDALEHRPDLRAFCPKSIQNLSAKKLALARLRKVARERTNDCATTKLLRQELNAPKDATVMEAWREAIACWPFMSKICPDAITKHLRKAARPAAGGLYPGTPSQGIDQSCQAGNALLLVGG